MLPKSYIDKIKLPIPKDLIQVREGGGNKKLRYVGGSYVISMLNYIFDYNWDWTESVEWIAQSQDKVYKDKNKGTETVTPQPPVCHVKGILVVHYLDEKGIERTIKKTGYGSKVITGGASEQESCYKSASTDAIKKAASMLGLGLELYMSSEEYDYFNELTYINPWTDEIVEKFRAELEYIESIKEMEDGESILAECIYNYSEEISAEEDFITPDNIADFVNYLKKLQEDEE